MSADRWQRIHELFETAEGVPSANRAALLESLCDDADIRAEVAALLACDDAAPKEFLRPPQTTAAATGDTHRDALMGTRVGQFHIDSIIGHGGMGTVYLATQENPRRKVAVKVMRPAFTTPQALRRFEFESKVLAHLRHPNIAHVYEAGVHRIPPSGLAAPYFAMEYIPDAQSITSYAANQDLPLRQSLELFEQVCAAVHHGHQKGVIHRDLKPGNILVDAAGLPKVIDFGVARGTDADLAITTMQTDAGQLVGTLQYMSPEQCDADPVALDTRSDVYSLGVVLYELLTETLPYETFGTSIYAATKVIKENRPARPSTLNRKLRGDLDSILLKALEKDRERRYTSAADLARDIRHFLLGEPVEAKPPARVTHVVNWTRRHPFGATAIACTSLVAIVVATLWVTVQLAHLTPYRVVLTDDERRATLLSWTNRPLFTWESDAPECLKALGTLVEAANPPGRLAVIGFRRSYPGQFSGKLCAFDTQRPSFNHPVWCSGIGEGDVPSTDREGFSARDFGIESISKRDIFSEIAGDEIVALFGHDFSYRCLRVYGSNGELLFQLWHNGAIASYAPMPASQLLVVAGELADHYDRGYWSDYDHPNAAQMLRQRYPLIMFALPLTVGSRLGPLIAPTSNHADPAIRWLRCLMPPPQTDAIGSWSFEDAVAGFQDGRHLLVRFHFFDDTTAHPKWHINDRGELTGRPLPDDHYNRNAKLPRLEQMYLGDLPERIR